MGGWVGRWVGGLFYLKRVVLLAAHRDGDPGVVENRLLFGRAFGARGFGVVFWEGAVGRRAFAALFFVWGGWVGGWVDR